jgi:hypothetical protein
MNNSGFLIIFILSCFSFGACQTEHNKTDYLPLIKELHQIECEQLRKAGINISIHDTAVYSFRSMAFDKIMTNKPDPKLIAHWEELNQKLAAMEYYMDMFEKKKYHEEFNYIYLEQCL